MAKVYKTEPNWYTFKGGFGGSNAVLAYTDILLSNSVDLIPGSTHKSYRLVRPNLILALV